MFEAKDSLKMSEKIQRSVKRVLLMRGREQPISQRIWDNRRFGSDETASEMCMSCGKMRRKNGFRPNR